ncbi:MAG: hypothetical protein QXJ93_01940 [Candidatus Rehaiarchaeum fermentans]|nr:hypothetical protein [Candidatus Rehaiarchaeum fermentans]
MEGTLSLYFYKISHEWWKLSVEQREALLAALDKELENMRSSKNIGLVDKFLLLSNKEDIGILLLSSQDDAPIYLKFKIDKMLEGYFLLSQTFFGITNFSKEENIPSYGAFSAFKVQDYLSSNRLEIEIENSLKSKFLHELNSYFKYYITRSGDLKENEYGVLFLFSNLSQFLNLYSNFLFELSRRNINVSYPLAIGKRSTFNLLLV